MRLTPDQRCLIGDAVDRTNNKSLVARVFGIARRTVYKWNKRRKYTKDRKRRKKKSKITAKVELSILAMRNFFEWGTERIQKGLYCLLKKFPQWLNGKIKEYQKWHNDKRINRGTNAIPCQLFT